MDDSLLVVVFLRGTAEDSRADLLLDSFLFWSHGKTPLNHQGFQAARGCFLGVLKALS